MKKSGSSYWGLGAEFIGPEKAIKATEDRIKQLNDRLTEIPGEIVTRTVDEYDIMFPFSSKSEVIFDLSLYFFVKDFIPRLCFKSDL